MLMILARSNKIGCEFVLCIPSNERIFDDGFYYSVYDKHGIALIYDTTIPLLSAFNICVA